MSSTVAQLGARVLRKLGVAIVADVNTQPDAATFTAAQIATRALRDIGIIVPEASRPAVSAAVALTELGARTIRACGGNPVSESDTSRPIFVTVTITDIAASALRSVGVSPFGPLTNLTNEPTVPLATIAQEVLTRLNEYDSGEAPSMVDLAEAETAVQGAIDALNRIGVINWLSSAIPAHSSEYLISMGMQVCAPAFGKTGSLEAYLQAESQLRLMALSGGDGQARAEAEVMAVHDRLSAMNIVAWNNTGIPQAALDSYVALTAAALVPVHSSATSGSTVSAAAPAATRMQLVEASIKAGDAAIAVLRTISMSSAYGQALAEAKITSVHDSLNAQALITWPLTAVPAAQAEDYVMMAATLLAPDFGLNQDAQSRQVNQAVWDAATARILKAARIAGAQALAQTKIADVQSELNAGNLVTWSSDQIPQAVADAMANLTAQSLAPSFGGKFDPEAYAIATKRVRMVVMGGAAGQALAEQKIRSVHSSLDMRGRVRWSLFDIPDAAEETYVLMAAWLLGPEVDVKVDPNWWALGERQISQFITLPATDRPVVGCYF